VDINELKRHWHGFGEMNPLWAILTTGPDPSTWDVDAFFETGQQQIADLMQQVQAFDYPTHWRRCLDFGCGVGRLTQALCPYFDHAHGVDIAASMIDLARSYNRFPDTCHYHLNTRSDLGIFRSDSFDFIYSVLVLQHMRPEYSKAYISEFLRILAPGGLLIFQIPGGYTSLRDEYSLPPSAMRAQILSSNLPTVIEPGQKQTISVTVKNTGDSTWPAQLPGGLIYHIKLGNHWLDAMGHPVVFDDGRTYLPHDVHPGEEAMMTLTITGPEQPGNYLLELDLVQEGVNWFGATGSPTWRHPIENRRGHSTAPAQAPEEVSAAEEKFIMELHCVEQAEVIDLIERNGGRLLHSYEDGNTGLEWQSFAYFVTKE